MAENIKFSNEEQDRLINKLVFDLEHRETDPGEIHSCPICGGQIHVTFSIYHGRKGKEKLGVGVRCDKCRYIMSADGGSIPKWVKRPGID
jgi:hypothetical protein